MVNTLSLLRMSPWRTAKGSCLAPHFQRCISPGPACSRGASHPGHLWPQLEKEPTCSEPICSPLGQGALALPFDPSPLSPLSLIFNICCVVTATGAVKKNYGFWELSWVERKVGVGWEMHARG